MSIGVACKIKLGGAMTNESYIIRLSRILSININESKLSLKIWGSRPPQVTMGATPMKMPISFQIDWRQAPDYNRRQPMIAILSNWHIMSN